MNTEGPTERPSNSLSPLGNRVETKFLTSSDLLELQEELKDRNQHKRGNDGFERPLYVSPLTWDQVEMIVNELIARRHEDRKKNGN